MKLTYFDWKIDPQINKAITKEEIILDEQFNFQNIPEEYFNDVDFLFQKLFENNFLVKRIGNNFTHDSVAFIKKNFNKIDILEILEQKFNSEQNAEYIGKLFPLFENCFLENNSFLPKILDIISKNETHFTNFVNGLLTLKSDYFLYSKYIWEKPIYKTIFEKLNGNENIEKLYALNEIEKIDDEKIELQMHLLDKFFNTENKNPIYIKNVTKLFAYYLSHAEATLDYKKILITFQRYLENPSFLKSFVKSITDFYSNKDTDMYTPVSKFVKVFSKTYKEIHKDSILTLLEYYPKTYFSLTDNLQKDFLHNLLKYLDKSYIYFDSTETTVLFPLLLNSDPKKLSIPIKSMIASQFSEQYMHEFLSHPAWKEDRDFMISLYFNFYGKKYNLSNYIANNPLTEKEVSYYVEKNLISLTNSDHLIKLPPKITNDPTIIANALIKNNTINTDINLLDMTSYDNVVTLLDTILSSDSSVILTHGSSILNKIDKSIICSSEFALYIGKILDSFGYGNSHEANKRHAIIQGLPSPAKEFINSLDKNKTYTSQLEKYFILHNFNSVLNKNVTKLKL